MTSKKQQIEQVTNDMPPDNNTAKKKERSRTNETADSKDMISNKQMMKQITDKAVKATPWSDEEIEELKEIFHSNYEKKTTPIKRELIEGLQRSKKNGGQIHQRKIESVKKKVSKMVVKLRKLSDVHETGNKKASNAFKRSIVE